MRLAHGAQRVLLAGLGVALLSGCGGTADPAGSGSCASAASFDGQNYLGHRVIDSDGEPANAESSYGPSIGSAASEPCESVESAENYSVYSIPRVDPADAIILRGGELEVYVHDELGQDPAGWPATLRAFLQEHPASTDI